jgi:hypothetical protein
VLLTWLLRESFGGYHSAESATKDQNSGHL